MRDILGDLETGHQPSDPDPVRRVQNQMRVPAARRFYEAVSVEPDAGGLSVRLDARPVKTPSGRAVSLPTERAARLVADEYAAQGDRIDPLTMPVTRLVNTAIDGVATDPQAVLEDIMRFSSSDLVCYRAEAPEALVMRQAEAWDPVLDWARSALGARFFLAEGVMPVEQPREAIAAVGVHLRQRDDVFRLASLHVITAITGSALLALALEAGAIDKETAWDAAHVDEDWNIEHWGLDAEAVARRAARKRDMMGAVALIEALQHVA
jgi:chaperone required for assembly of F1-ATPase